MAICKIPLPKLDKIWSVVNIKKKVDDDIAKMKVHFGLDVCHEFEPCLQSSFYEESGEISKDILDSFTYSCKQQKYVKFIEGNWNKKEKEGEKKINEYLQFGVKNKNMWTTARGEEIEISELEDEHLDNITKMLSTNLAATKNQMLILDEHDATEKKAKEILSKEILETRDFLRIMLAESAKRAKK